MAPSAVPSSLLAPAVWETPAGEHVQVQVDNEQVHGRACVRCGSTLDGLVDAGHLHAGPGGWLLTNPGGWRAKACPHHTGEEKAA